MDWKDKRRSDNIIDLRGLPTHMHELASLLHTYEQQVSDLSKRVECLVDPKECSQTDISSPPTIVHNDPESQDTSNDKTPQR